MRRPLTGVLLACLALAGCGYKGAESLPLPGAVGGPDTYRVTAVFSDATKLVPKQTCRAGDTVVGSVESITLDSELKARVVCVIKNSVSLPGNAVAQLRETALLGERYVALNPPRGERPVGRLRPGGVLPENTAHVDPDTEQVLGALSAVLNGGSLGRIADINSELNAALSGRTASVRGVLDKLGRLTGELNAHRDDITAALDSLDRLSATVAKQRHVLGLALDAIPDGLRVLDNQRPKLTATLRSLTELSEVAVPLIEQSKASAVANLKHLQPILAELGKNGREIAASLETSTSFPFSGNARYVFKGDYGGFFATEAVDLDFINSLLGTYLAGQGPEIAARRPRSDGPGTPGTPAIPAIPELPSLGSVPGAVNPVPAENLADLLTGGGS